MSRSMIKQRNSGATAHVVLYTPRQSTKCISKQSHIIKCAFNTLYLYFYRNVQHLPTAQVCLPKAWIPPNVTQNIDQQMCTCV